MAFTDFYADQQRRKQSDEADYVAAQTRENAASDTRKTSLGMLKELNSGQYPLISVDPNRAPASGYNNAEGYYQGMDDQQTIATHNGGSVRFGGTVAQRPSLAALKGADPNDWTARMNAPDDIAPTFEQQRQGRTLSSMDDRLNRQLEDERRTNNANFDIGSGQAAARAQGVGDIKRDQGLQDARQDSTIYEDPLVSRTREAQFADEMRKIKERYSMPAYIKGQSEIDAAATHGQAGVERQGAINTGAMGLQGSRNEGARDVAGIRANAQMGSAVAAAGGNPESYRPDQAGGGKTMTQAEFAAWSAQSGLNEQDARRVAQQQGYRIQ